MWRYHIKKFFILDMIAYLIFFALWVVLIDKDAAESERVIAVVLIGLNSLYLCRELWQSDFCRHVGYFSSGWNQIDLACIGGVYGYSIPVAMNGKNVPDLVPLAVVTTLFLTMVRLSNAMSGSKISMGDANRNLIRIV
jgi:hypothetical protein